MKTKVNVTLSVILLISGIVSWIPYVVFDIQKPFGMLTFVVNPIGCLFGFLARNKFLAYSNLLMAFSIIPVIIYVFMTKGYIPM